VNSVDRARALLHNGDSKAGAGVLEAAGAAGDASCWTELAFWHLQGRGIPRDLARSRHCFRAAAAAGDTHARAIYIAFLANGTGGPSDFAGALRLLAEAAPDDPDAARQLALIAAMNLTEDGDPHVLPQPRQVSERPFAQIFPGLLGDDECRYLVDAAEPAFRQAQVGSLATGQKSLSQVRTCETAGFPWVAENPVIHAINRRIAAASGFPVECGEPLQILRYRGGQEFKPHYDCTETTDNQRVLTMLVYLNEAYTGGETLFLKTGLKLRGRAGDGLLFRNARDDGSPDMESLHAGLPVTSGEKLIASRWIRQKRFGPAA
jgi:prolyl 4-hydroxylase